MKKKKRIDIYKNLFFVNMVIMPKHRVEICPQCSQNVKTSQSRLIRDTCGHKKCRLCLMKEEKGCVACAAKVRQEDSKSLDTGNQRHSVSAESINTNSDSSNELNITAKHLTVYGKKTGKHKVSEKVNNASSKPKKRKTTMGSHMELLSGSPKKYRCTVCDKICSTKMTLRYHNYCASETKPFTCETCGKGFVTKSHYNYHMKIHTGALPYVCSVCGKGFKEKGKLARHLKSHSDERPFVCQECGKTFANNESLKSHQRTHAGEKPHVCPVCSKAFIEHSNYKKHVFFHQGEKMYMCDICGKTFAMKRSLATHTLMIHERERNHVCNLCNRKFTLKKDLKRHAMVHSVVRPHSCTLCNIGFRRKDNLERHMKNTHPETRMVIIGSNKPKAHEISKSTPDTVRHRNRDSTGDTDEADVDDPLTPLPPSPIPPSQTVNVESLRSVEKISSEKNSSSKNKDNISSGVNEVAQHTEHTETINYLPTDGQVNYTPAVSDTTLTEELLSAQLPEQCYENVRHKQKADDSVMPYNIIQETNQSVTHTIYPPKKNIEYYRAVPVINRSSNVINSCSNETNCQTVNTNDQQEIARRVEGTNCVPTITRACEYMPGSVITRNLQQTNPSVLKPISRHDHYQTLDSLPTSNQAPHSDQPSLRKLLHDVKCSDGSDILNLTNDVSMNKRTLFPNDLRQIDSVKYDRASNVEAHFYPPKYTDTYLSETSIQNEINEYSSHSSEQYLTPDYSRKITGVEGETLFSGTHIRQNYTSLNYDLIQPSYTGYDEGIGQSLPHYSDVVAPTDLVTRYSSELNKSNVDKYMCGTKHIDSDGKLKHFADVTHSAGDSCTQGVSLPVIVGTKKISNNVIYTNFST